MRKLILFLVAVTIALTVSRVADAYTITFNEQPLGTIADGMTIDIVTFDFTVGGSSSTDATITSTIGPGNTPLLQTPYLEGDTTGILGLNFGSGVSSLDYVFGLSTGQTVTNASTVTIFDSIMNPLGTFSANASVPAGFTFAEGLLSLTSPTPIYRAEISFNTTIVGARFAADNIAYQQVPEPGTLLLLGSGLAGLGFVRRRFKS